MIGSSSKTLGMSDVESRMLCMRCNTRLAQIGDKIGGFFLNPGLSPLPYSCPFENPNIVGGTLFRVQFSNSRLAGLVSTPGPVSQSPGTLAVDQP